MRHSGSRSSDLRSYLLLRVASLVAEFGRWLQGSSVISAGSNNTLGAKGLELSYGQQAMEHSLPSGSLVNPYRTEQDLVRGKTWFTPTLSFTSSVSDERSSVVKGMMCGYKSRVIQETYKVKQLALLVNLLHGQHEPGIKPVTTLHSLLNSTASSNPSGVTLSREQFARVLLNHFQDLGTKQAQEVYSAWDPRSRGALDVELFICSILTVWKAGEGVRVAK